MDRGGEFETHWRDRLLTAAAFGMGCLLLAVMLLRAITEAGGTNAYALVAESLLTGRPDASTCFGADCAVIGGKTYIVFPPFPGALVMPLVWLKGVYATGFNAIALLLWAGSLGLWNRIARFMNLDGAARFWLLAAIGFASPLFYVTLRGEGVWFFAQACAFFFVTLAIHEALIGKRLITAGLALGCAFLSRQMSIFYGPLLLLLWLNPGERVFRVDWRRVGGLLLLGAPVLLALVAYFVYNAWRFGDPLETGYKFITFEPGLMKTRMDAHGLWDGVYGVYNLFYFFLQGFHATFAEPELTKLTGLDPGGSSFLAASPWLLLFFFAARDMRTLTAVAMIAGFTALLVFYHSNGFSQYNTQRYALDWLPAALAVMIPALTAQRLEWFRLLAAWGMLLNVATVAVLALTKSG